VDPLTIAALLVAGFFAGAINAVVGAGTLITYAALIALGVSPVAANATNTTGVGAGSWASVVAYRRELSQRWRELVRPAALCIVGAFVGVMLVLALPERVFVVVVPWLIAGAAILVWVQPLLAKQVYEHGVDSRHRRPRPLFWGSGLVGIYGGYFGAAQGVMFMALLGSTYDRDPQESNAAKNLLASCANVTAAITFVVAGKVLWPQAIAIGFGALLGGYLGGSFARKLPRSVLRGTVVAVGLGAAVLLLVQAY
jgi:hypothetical protein